MDERMASEGTNLNEGAMRSRWTCEACGCNTNSVEENPTSCSLCGSSRQAPDLLGRNEPLASQLLRRSFFVRRAQAGLDIHRSFNRSLDQMENDMMDEDDDDEAVAEFALEVAGVSNAARITGARSRRDMLLRAAQESLPMVVGLTTTGAGIPPNELLQAAVENAASYDPQWAPPLLLGIRRQFDAIEVGRDDFSNVATLPVGAAEGKSIRALQAIPGSTEGVGADQPRRKAFGFKIVFKRPYKDVGKTLGGGYLIGITSSSFNSFDDRNSLQQSGLFWGIDDTGHKYEGNPSGVPLRGARRAPFGTEISARYAPRNSANLLYGCLETITVIVDIDSASLSFWRETEFLGTLVRNIPRTGDIFPIAVPFNGGSIATITGLNGCPLVQTQRYEAHVNQILIQMQRSRRHDICQQRAVLVHNGEPSEELTDALHTVFGLYQKPSGPADRKLDVISAARLWYRSGLKLSHLDAIVDRKTLDEEIRISEATVGFNDFYDVILDILKEDESFYANLQKEFREESLDNCGLGSDPISTSEDFQVGDIVELIEGYEKFGDASRGPLVLGDRGQVVEVQQGANGERYSIRVLFNGRRWWYQPQTLLAEKSGLVATPGVWFVQRLLRAHGLDHLSLRPMWGNQVTSSSWLVGDVVVPLVEVLTTEVSPDPDKKSSLASVTSCLVGKIVPPSAVSSTQGLVYDRSTGTVCVEFVDPLFGLRVGIADDSTDERTSSRVHRVDAKELVHAGISQLTSDAESMADESCQDKSCLSQDVLSVAMLDVSAIESISQECAKSLGALARAFAAGLPAAVTSAVERARSMARKQEEDPNLLPAIAALGNMIVNTASHICRPSMSALQAAQDSSEDMEEIEDNEASRDLKSNNSSSLMMEEDDEQQIPLLPLRPFGAVSSAPFLLQSRFLNSVRRGGFESLLPGDDLRRGIPILNAATKSAISNGILANNFVWFSRVVETAKRRKGPSTAASFVNACDEDGLPLVLIAVSLGCSRTLLSYLISNGAKVDGKVIKKAAYIGQKDLLECLLVEYVCSDDLINLDLCTVETVETMEAALHRQKEQEEALRRNGEGFISTIASRLLDFGNELRSCLKPKIHLYRSVAQILVGRVLLRAMHFRRIDALTASETSAPGRRKGSKDSESGRIAIFEDNGSYRSSNRTPSAIAASEGLLFVVQAGKLGLFDNETGSGNSLVSYLRFMESLLWTKHVDDVALGLTMLAVLLRHTPMGVHAAVCERYGIHELLTLHERESQHQLSYLRQKLEHLKSNSKRFSIPHIASHQNESVRSLFSGVVLCPKLHLAELHLTRHSSFRCDLCGKGVERGFPMHGCRECDWDACEDCIKKNEGGVVNWNHALGLISECRSLVDTGEQFNDDTNIGEFSDKEWSLQVLAARIKALDRDALKECVELLDTDGNVTLFEFASYLLPALFDSLLLGGPGAELTAKKDDKTFFDPPKKKQRPQFTARISRGVDRHEFLSAASNTLVHGALKCRADGTSAETATNQIPVILRYLHEVLSFCEDFPVLHDEALGGGDDSNDLQSLTKPLALELLPIAQSLESTVRPFTVSVEPLTKICDLKDLIIRSVASDLPSYINYSQRLSEDQCIIAHRAMMNKSSMTIDSSVYQIAQVSSFDAESGFHTVRCARAVNPNLISDRTARIDVSATRLSEAFLFQDYECPMVLCSREFVVLERFKDARRDEYKCIVQNVMKAKDIADHSARTFPQDALPLRTRVELLRPQPGGKQAYRIIGCSEYDESHFLQGQLFYDVVSDNGDVLKGVPHKDVRPDSQGLSRTWSALSLIENLSPVDLNDMREEGATSSIRSKVCDFDVILSGSFEVPALPFVSLFHPNEFSPVGQHDDATIYASVRANGNFVKSGPTKIFFDVHNGEAKSTGAKLQAVEGKSSRPEWTKGAAIKSMNVINELTSSQEMSKFEHDPVLISQSLTRKLSEQLDQTLSVVSGALPSWCTELPMMAPRLFSYDVRRQLLECCAFGVSRAAMRLQEAKVNVAPLRRRMAALRGRAVELVGEAFSGGAEDPTALQLQADELYGMEEAVGARVAAAFRAQKWQERALQCAKAVVRRDYLLEDAAKVMSGYARSDMVKQRRLEIRFEGESGFDAASGDEAGVTRGFYADVAEALLSCEHVLVNPCGVACSPTASVATPLVDIEPFKLPLWIPDLDAGCQVVIPTPRVCPESNPGVYPRPLARNDPLMSAVRAQFRFMGRMFAGAMRDGFMFPLPLSSSFLRLVQSCTDKSFSDKLVEGSLDGKFEGQVLQKSTTERAGSPLMNPSDATDEYSYEENTPTAPSKSSPHRFGVMGHDKANTAEKCLVSSDLPRPGFLGGEVFAVEHYVCKALDKIDALNLQEDEAEKRYLQVSADKSFAREAFGKDYDCSFDDYFENKTFVDPLDPSQGPAAAPLCPNGHLRDVNIFNVREWLLLAKRFILFDGVVEQARAFRQGINDFFPADNLSLFTSSELQRDVCGGSDRVENWTDEDIRKLFRLDGVKGASEALVAVAAIGGEGGAALSRRFGSSSPTISYLIKTLLNSNSTQRRQFLSFVTSVPIVTPGKIEVVPILSPSGDFLPVEDNCLPRANTCARRLYLPKFDSYENFSSVLWAVIREESKFKGFYEWRGN